MSIKKQPVVREVGVLALVPDDWGASWQTRHQILSRLASYFYVVWMDPAQEWREALKMSKDTGAKEADPLRWPGLIIYSPELWAPKFYRPKWLSRLTFKQRLKRARRLLITRGCRKFVMYIWRPDFAQALKLIPFDLSCYHIDDEYTFSDKDLPVTETEAGLIANANQVFIHSPALMEKKGLLNPQTSFVPNGVDFKCFSSPAPEPFDLLSIPRPRIGYVGFIKRTLDWPLLADLTLRHPEWSFVFVGPVRPDPEVETAMKQLGSHPNVHFLAAKSKEAIAAYPQHFDVCIMPYRTTDYARYLYPLKLHEYLASGRPIVGARMRSLEEFSNVVALPRSPQEWSDAICRALSDAANTPSLRAARQQIAASHDWSLLVRRIAGILALRLGPDVSKLLQQVEPEPEALRASGV